MKMKVAIVIPSWNAADIIGGCLRSLEAQTYPNDIVVVDNGSADESVRIIEEQFPKTTLIKLAGNKGFAGGVNAGFRYALDNGYDAVAVFNNDATADKDWLKQLVSVLEQEPTVGIVGSKQLFEDKVHIDAVGNEYSVWGVAFPKGRGERDDGQYDKPGVVFGAAGGGLLCSTAMLREIGLLDETFFIYYEDVDLSFRARLAGWQVRYAPEAKIYHKVSVSSDKLGSLRRYHMTKNFHLVFLKNMPGWLFWKYLPLATLQGFRLGLGSIVRFQFLSHVRGYLAAVFLIPYALRERRWIQRNRKVTPAHIDALLYHGRPPRRPTSS